MTTMNFFAPNTIGSTPHISPMMASLLPGNNGLGQNFQFVNSSFLPFLDGAMGMQQWPGMTPNWSMGGSTSQSTFGSNPYESFMSAILIGLITRALNRSQGNQRQQLEAVEPVVIGDSAAQIWGDPHFVDFQGGKYDVMGKPGGTYNIISDKNLQYNATFGSWKGKQDETIIDTVGFTVGTPKSGLTRIEFTKGGQPPKVNGKELAKGQKATFNTGLTDENGRPVRGSAVWDGKTMKVVTGEYQVALEDKGDHLDQVVNVTSLGVLSDGVLSHGLLGQTADGVKREGKQGKGAQGEGAIAGIVTDYEVDSLFGDNTFRFNRFGVAAYQPRQFGVLAGKNGTAE